MPSPEAPWPDDVVPDQKDWTWVLSRPCEECGFDAASFDPSTAGAALRVNAAAWADALRHARVRDRPNPATWSALEYACHVRDVYVLYNERLRLMLETDDPLYQNWDQDATARQDRYAAQDPADVAPALSRAAEALAARFDGVRGEQWQRTGTRSDGARFTVASFAGYLMHDPIHHLHDVVKGFAVLAH
jgi:hypothetical protein